MARNGRSKGSRRRPHTRTSAAQGVQPTIAPCARSARPCNRMDGPARVIAAPTACLAPPWQHATGQTQHPRASRAHRCGTDCRQAGRAGGRGAALGDATPWQARLEKRLKDEERANKLATREQVRPGWRLRPRASTARTEHYMHLAMFGRLLTCLRGCSPVCWFVSCAHLPATSVGSLGSRPRLLLCSLRLRFACDARWLPAGWLVCWLVFLRVRGAGCLFACVRSRVCVCFRRAWLDFMLARWMAQAKAEKEKGAKQAEADKAKKVSTQSAPREYLQYPV